MSVIQRVFNAISLQKDESLWMSDDDSRLEDRLKLIAEFDEAGIDFAGTLDANAGAIKMCGKNQKIASALTEKANLLYAQGETNEALQLYNQALQFCPLEDAGIVFGARSAVWVDKQRWDLTISDINMALDLSGLTKQYESTLLERMGHALGSLGKEEEAVTAIDQSIQALTQSGMKGGRLKSKVEQLNRLKKSVASLMAKNGNGKSNDIWFPSLPSPGEMSANPKLPNMSESVTVRYEEGRGRFCVAKKDISAGELIAVDEAYTWLLDKLEVKNLCWNCLRPLLAPIPCHKCSGVLFCGKKCQAESSSSHKSECGITETIFQANIGAWALALRALARHPWSYYMENREEFSTHDELSGVGEDSDKNSTYDSNSIKTFHNLVSHDGPSCNKQAPELMMQALVAIFLLRCLQFTGYLPFAKSPRSLSSEELFAAKLLHHFMRVAYYNTHETVITESDGETVRRVGRCTNPTLALFNHSCHPNYRRVSYGRNTLAFAIRDIRKGEEILDTYTSTFASSEKSKRHGELAKYNFVCNCRACANEWPVFSKLNKGTLLKDKAQVIKKLEATALKLKKSKGDPSKLLSIQRQLSPLYSYSEEPPTQIGLRSEDFLYKALSRMYGLRCDTFG